MYYITANDGKMLEKITKSTMSSKQTETSLAQHECADETS